MIALGFGLGLPVFGGGPLPLPWWLRYVFGWKGMNEKTRDWLIWMLSGKSQFVRDGSCDDHSERQGAHGARRECREVDLEKGADVEEWIQKDRNLCEERPGVAPGGVRLRGWVFIDFADEPRDLLPLLIECNFVET